LSRIEARLLQPTMVFVGSSNALHRGCGESVRLNQAFESGETLLLIVER
jgi:hypothetical protein